MRIALYHNLPSGGAKRAVFELVRRLSAVHQIDVFTLSSADHTFCDLRPFVNEHHVFNFSAHRSFLSPWGRLNQLQRLRDLNELARVNSRIAQAINAGAYDVVFVHPCRHTQIPLVLSYLHGPSVYYLHEPLGALNPPAPQRDPAKLKDYRAAVDHLDPLIHLYTSSLALLQIKNITKPTLLLACSKYTQASVKAKIGREVEVAYLGVNGDNFYPIADMPSDGTVISVGELTPRKAFDFLVESLARIPAHRRPVLKLVSNSESLEERRRVETLAAARGVELRILNLLDTAALNVEYNRSVLCVYSPKNEPFGLVPLEAMACGLPVVAGGAGGVRETVLDGVTGALVKRDYDEFAAATLALLEDPTRRQQVGRQAYEYVRQTWGWESATTRIEAYLALAATQPRTSFRVADIHGD